MQATQERTALQEKLIDYIQDAHALECNVLHMLDSMKATTKDPETLARIDRHREETRRQQHLLRGRLEAWGASPSVPAEVPAEVSAWIKGPGPSSRPDSGRQGSQGGFGERLEGIKEGVMDNALDLCLVATGAALAGYIGYHWWNRSRAGSPGADTRRGHEAGHAGGGIHTAMGTYPLQAEPRTVSRGGSTRREHYPWVPRRGEWGGFPGHRGDHLGGSDVRGSLAGTSQGSSAGMGVAGVSSEESLREFVRDIPGSRDMGDWSPSDVCDILKAVPAGSPLPGQGDQPGP